MLLFSCLQNSSVQFFPVSCKLSFQRIAVPVGWLSTFSNSAVTQENAAKSNSICCSLRFSCLGVKSKIWPSSKCQLMFGPFHVEVKSSCCQKMVIRDTFLFLSLLGVKQVVNLVVHNTGIGSHNIGGVVVKIPAWNTHKCKWFRHMLSFLEYCINQCIFEVSYFAFSSSFRPLMLSMYPVAVLTAPS